MIPKKMAEWLVSIDCYGNRMLEDWEAPLIIKRWNKIKNSIVILNGSLKEDMPNYIMVSVSKSKLHKEGRKDKKQMSLSHYLRPCPNKECKNGWQYECHLTGCEEGSCYERCT